MLEALVELVGQHDHLALAVLRGDVVQIEVEGQALWLQEEEVERRAAVQGEVSPERRMIGNRLEHGRG